MHLPEAADFRFTVALKTAFFLIFMFAQTSLFTLSSLVMQCTLSVFASQQWFDGVLNKAIMAQLNSPTS